MEIDWWLSIVILIMCSVSFFFMGEFVESTTHETIYKTEIVYINQTDNCLNEIVKAFEENKEVIETITEYIEENEG